MRLIVFAALLTTPGSLSLAPSLSSPSGKNSLPLGNQNQFNWETATFDVDENIRKQIVAEICQVEKDHAVKVLCACESGSRAWGFPSADSDCNVVNWGQETTWLSADRRCGSGSGKDHMAAVKVRQLEIPLAAVQMVDSLLNGAKEEEAAGQRACCLSPRFPSVVCFGTISNSSAVVWEMDSGNKICMERIFARSKMTPMLWQSTC